MPTSDAPDFAQGLLGAAQQQNVMVSSTTSLALAVQKNGATVAAEAALDFEDGTNVTWTVADDGANGRVKVTPVHTEAAGTSFPGSPVDGQVYVYKAATGVLWRFVYNTTDTAWGFVGGPPLFASVATFESTSSATYAALATAGPSVVVPFAADYVVAIGAAIGIGQQASEGFMSYDIGGTGAVDGDFIQATSPATGGTPDRYWSVSRIAQKTGLTAVALTAKYKSGGGSWQFGNRYMAVWPVKK